MNNEKIKPDMTMREMLMVMSEGNIGALNVLMNMMKNDPFGFFSILPLDSMDIRGEQIWRLYKDCSGENFDKFMRTIDVLRSGGYTQEEITANLTNEYYSIPFGDPTAVNGKWEKGPGIELFQAMEQKIGKQEIIAEDLGFLTDSVKKMLRDTGYPGMKVLQFAFDSREESDYMPHNYDKNCVVYTGTHDNTTTFSWWKSELPRKDKEVALRYLDLPTIFLTNRKLTWQLIVFAERSVADLCIIPAWDFLMLDKEARINTPSTLGNNWCWRMEKNAFGAGLCYKIREMCRLYGRTPRDN